MLFNILIKLKLFVIICFEITALFSSGVVIAVEVFYCDDREWIAWQRDCPLANWTNTARPFQFMTITCFSLLLRKSSACSDSTYTDDELASVIAKQN